MNRSIVQQDEVFFTLLGRRSSYSIQIYRNEYPLHLHWGPRAFHSTGKAFFSDGDRSFLINPDAGDRSFYIEDLQCEYGYGEHGDFRTPAFMARDGDNYPITGPFDVSTRIVPGKPALEGLPSSRTEEGEGLQTLEVVMEDSKSGLAVTLRYTPFPEYDALARSAVFTNNKKVPITIDRAMSMSIDIRNWDYRLLYLHGAWARERYVQRCTIQPGLFTIGSVRGTSSHQFNPFLALIGPDTDEHGGEAFGVSLVYSGNFAAEAERNYDDNIRFNMGIHPETFTWKLDPGESFYTPEAIMIYADDGLNGLSDRFHRFTRERIFPPRFRERPRPILFNNWEATYFDFDEEKLEVLAGRAADLGIELFVLDDGWFGKRDSDKTSLGDWWTNTEKLPGGLESLGEKVEELGMEFGLWIEPEMISRKSRLFEEHPQWCLHIPDRPVAEGRNQLVLDLSREEVRRFLVKTIDGILSSAPVSYIKWDMNRYLTNVASRVLPPSQQREVYHRYVLGLYDILEQLTQAHPDVLFEGCSGGGGRFDMGILYYMPQYWTSDNTDAVSRLKIQYGTSLLYPPVSIGAHVSAVPNHQVNRVTPLHTRGNVALSGNFGYELDISRLDEEESEQIREQIDFYKSHRELIQFGRFLRLRSPFDSDETAWMFIAPDDSEILVFWFLIHREANQTSRRLRLSGLPEGAVYEHAGSGARYGSEELMARGMILPDIRHDFESMCLHLRKADG